MNLNNYFQSHFYTNSTYKYSRNKQDWIVNGRNSQHSAHHCSNFPLTHNLCLFIVLWGTDPRSAPSKMYVSDMLVWFAVRYLHARVRRPLLLAQLFISVIFKCRVSHTKDQVRIAIGGQRKWRVTPRQTILELLANSNITDNR